MTDRKTASTINDTELDALYAELAGAREELRLTDSMRQANLDAAAAALQRAEQAEAAITRVRALAVHARDHSAAGLDDYQIGQHDLAVDVLTALDQDVLADLAQNGVETPGCDCGHDGMGAKWHGTDCPWRVGKQWEDTAYRHAQHWRTAEAAVARVREYAEICIAEHNNDASASWILHLIEPDQPARTTPNNPATSNKTTTAGTEETEPQETP